MANEPNTEEWRIVEGWPDYEVSNHGRVRRAKPFFFMNPKNGQRCVRFPAGRFLKQWPDDHGYFFVILSQDGRKKTYRIAVMVCEIFHGPKPTNTHHAAHDDGDHTNNKADNLAWKTPKENGADKLRHGTPARGERNGNARLTLVEVQAMRVDMANGRETMPTIARHYGVSIATVEAIKYGRLWKHL